MLRPMNNTTKLYEVCLFGSHPDKENDDCWTGEDYATLEEAQACVASFLAGEDPKGWKEGSASYYLSSTAYFVIMHPQPGPNDTLIKNPKFDRRQNERDDADWQREIAMEAGMCLGIDAYNDAMGY